MMIHDDLWRHLRVKNAHVSTCNQPPCRHPDMHQSCFPHCFHMPWNSRNIGNSNSSNWPTLAAMELICVCRFCCLFLLLHLGTMGGIFWGLNMRNLNDKPSIFGVPEFQTQTAVTNLQVAPSGWKANKFMKLVCIPETQPNSGTNVIISEQNT